MCEECLNGCSLIFAVISVCIGHTHVIYKYEYESTATRVEYSNGCTRIVICAWRDTLNVYT